MTPYDVLGAVGTELFQACLEGAAVSNKGPCVRSGAFIARGTTLIVTTVGADGEH